MTDDLPPLIDDAALRKFLDEKLPGDGEITIERHQAGHSNETFFLSRGDNSFVLRRPPRGAFLPTAHDVGREYRVLSALKDIKVRTPRTLLMCDDESVIGAPFYVMERIRGVVMREEPPPSYSETDRADVASELVDALVELHAADWAACGLEGFGKPVGYLERQLRRWNGQMELTLPLTRPVGDLQRVGEWLTSKLPESGPATVVHGDYKLDNVIFDAERPRLLAILDWEMATIGDPLADLGWMISFWRESGDEEVVPGVGATTSLPGFPPRSELIERYAAATGRDVAALDWYVVLAIWKLAILLEGSYARHLAGMTDDPFFAEMEHAVPALARRALEIATG